LSLCLSKSPSGHPWDLTRFSAVKRASNAC
jgi:hypothetical protein